MPQFRLFLLCTGPSWEQGSQDKTNQKRSPKAWLHSGLPVDTLPTFLPAITYKSTSYVVTRRHTTVPEKISKA
jgi:hypothetical protein